MSHRAIHTKITVNAPVTDVWNAWTTVEGCRSFLAPDCRLELKIGGAYEMLFMLENKPGLQGGEGCTVLAFENERMLSFTWNAPPSMPEIRKQYTHVTLYFDADGEKTNLTFHHDGWGVGPDWDEAFHYFTRAWLDVVMPRLQHRFVKGPVDWDNPPVFK